MFLHLKKTTQHIISGKKCVHSFCVQIYKLLPTFLAIIVCVLDVISI